MRKLMIGRGTVASLTVTMGLAAAGALVMAGQWAQYRERQTPNDIPIKIGIVASQNGPLRPWGLDAINGAKLAVDEVNASGGINGRKIELLIVDSASRPESGKSAAERLVAEGVDGMLGEVASGITQPMAMISSEHGIPHVVIGATKGGITEIGVNVFRVCYTDDLQAHAMAKFAYESLGLRKMMLVSDKKQPYSIRLSEQFRQSFSKLGGEIADELFYESGQPDFTDLIARLKEIQPEGAFLSGFFTEVGPFVKQAAELGVSGIQYLGGDGWDSTELLASGGNAIVGGYFPTHFHPDMDTPGARNFMTAWRTKYDSVPGTAMAALGYDAAKLMMDAMRRAGTTDSEAVIAALADTVAFQGATGRITLKGHGGDAERGIVVIQVTQDGYKFATSFSYEEIYGGRE